MKNKKRNKMWVNRLIHLGVNLLIFFTVFLIKDTGSGMFFLLTLIPIVIAVNSIVYSIRVKYFDIIYAILTGLMFIPFVLVKMNSSAMIYVLIYLAIAGGLNLLGAFIVGGKKALKMNLKKEFEENVKDVKEKADDVIDSMKDK